MKKKTTAYHDLSLFSPSKNATRSPTGISPVALGIGNLGAPSLFCFLTLPLLLPQGPWINEPASFSTAGASNRTAIAAAVLTGVQRTTTPANSASALTAVTAETAGGVLAVAAAGSRMKRNRMLTGGGRHVWTGSKKVVYPV